MKQVEGKGCMRVTEHDQGNQNIVPFYQTGDYFFHRGVEAFRKKNHQRAIKLLERAIKLTAQEPVFHVQLAAILSEVGDYERSNGILKRVLKEQDGNVAECYFFMANNYAYLGFFHEAEQATKNYLELSEDQRFAEDARNLLELLRFEAEDTDWEDEMVVEEEYELLMQHDQALRLLRSGQWNESIPLLEEIIDEHPTYWAAYIQAAEAYFRIGDKQSAYELCQAVLDKEQGNVLALCQLAMLYWQDGQTKKAEPYIHALRQLYPIDVEQKMKVAEVLCQCGDYEQAYQRLKSMKKAILETKTSALCCLGIAAHFLYDPDAMRFVQRAAKLGDEQAKRIVRGELNISEAQIWQGSF
ncbi:lipopolysaccharide assembly protein LapB [Halalkalibacter sp. APA_J-10(15)]|uniref:tetratricopeptide repeat protein n=1 Tax=Halalkalibacter sp. APA_J-10(15) TaxID=2933805 RepID=UPI001FF57A69|nr:tetratricopeptide repeat protein [Halalkalibacter sp. APA_J-10(15)]MCK0473002.1 tetratricopeptide repeat protein [Halalkalibacter sp. APA_J-10(15)]